MYKGKKIGVIVPAFNEELLISNTLKGIPEFIDKVYFIDDCSTDNTLKIASTISKIDKRISVDSIQKNLGVGGAITLGFEKAINDEMEIVAVMAGDNQMDPQYLPELLEPIISDEADFTKGNRLIRGYWKGMSLFRLIGNFLLSFFTKLVTGYWNINDSQNGFIAISMAKLKEINLANLCQGYVFENDLMLKANLEQIRMRNVLIPAKYGNEISKIKYGRFIFKTSLFLVKGFFWRIWKKYFEKFKPNGLLYLLSFVLLISGIITPIVTSNLLFLFFILGSASTFTFATIIDGYLSAR